MTTMTETKTTQVYQVFIRATPEAIWDAITKPEWTQRYGYRGISEFELQPGGSYRAKATAEFQTGGARGRRRGDRGRPAAQARPHVALPVRRRGQGRGPTRVTFDIKEGEAGVSRLTVTHELECSDDARAACGRDRGRRRRLGRPQRPQDAAGDGRGAARLSGSDERDDVAPVRVDGIEPLDDVAAPLLPESGTAAVSHIRGRDGERSPRVHCRPVRIRSARSPFSWATRKRVVIEVSGTRARTRPNPNQLSSSSSHFATVGGS